MAKLKRINARIDTDLERLVHELAQIKGLSTSDIVVKALQEFCASQSRDAGAGVFDAFSKAGLIGCFKAGRNLSRDYKEEVERALRNKWPGT